MEEKTWITKSSGKQQDFGTGAKRDTSQGKGRFDLVPIRALSFVAEKYGEFGKSLNGKSTQNIGHAINCLYGCLDKNNPDDIEEASEAVWYILEFMEHDGRFYEELPEPEYDIEGSSSTRYDLIPYPALKRVADVYERGADLYGERNWENGMPLARLLDSSIRHLFQCIAGKEDEDHAAQGAWNALGFIETLWRIEQDYLPKSLDNRLDLKKKDLLNFDGEEVVEKTGGFPAAMSRALDGYGFETKPFKFEDGYGSRNKTLFGQTIGSPTNFAFDEGAFDFDDESVDEEDW